MRRWTNTTGSVVGGAYPGGGGEGEGQGEKTWDAESSAWLLDEVDAVLDEHNQVSGGSLERGRGGGKGGRGAHTPRRCCWMRWMRCWTSNQARQVRTADSASRRCSVLLPLCLRCCPPCVQPTPSPIDPASRPPRLPPFRPCILPPHLHPPNPAAPRPCISPTPAAPADPALLLAPSPSGPQRTVTRLLRDLALRRRVQLLCVSHHAVVHRACDALVHLSRDASGATTADCLGVAPAPVPPRQGPAALAPPAGLKGGNSANAALAKGGAGGGGGAKAKAGAGRAAAGGPKPGKARPGSKRARR